MSLYLYGIMESTDEINFGKIGFGEVLALSHQGLAAVVGHAPEEDFTKVSREKLIQLLLSHQETLEKINKNFFVLPCKFGTILRDPQEAQKLLNEQFDLIRYLMEKVKGCIEIDLLATWDVKKTLQEIAEVDPDIMAYKKQAGDVNRTAVGMLLVQNLQKKALQLRTTVSEILRGYAQSSAEHDLLNDAMVVNTSFLVHQAYQNEFYQALEKIDAQLQNKLSFKCVGPLPPYSFSTVTLKRFNPDEIEKAARFFQLNGKAELSQIKQIYRKLSRQYHPDQSSSTPEQFEALNHAYQLLVDYCEDRPRSLNREAVEQSLRLMVVKSPEVCTHAA